jgi:aminopeptidase N
VERLFRLTPDMIGFFSRATGVEYPFEKYAQFTVRDFIFGGQENVSATTLTDAALHDAQAEIDDPTTTLVAHELGQHWFGDYAQGRDWANIWLNEGFATYMTALYTQYHESNDAYRYEIYNDQNTALQVEASRGPRPLVAREYVDPLDMLEEITHDKGAAVLDMMRYVLDGDAAMQSPGLAKRDALPGVGLLPPSACRRRGRDEQLSWSSGAHRYIDQDVARRPELRRSSRRRQAAGPLGR